MPIRTVEALEAALATPSARLIVDMGRLDGDLLVLGAGGKMGPSLAMLARNALDAAGASNQVIAVSRFGDEAPRQRLEDAGVRTIAADLMNDAELQALPDAAHVVHMAAMKFGTSGSEHLTWAMNTYLPGRVGERYRDARIVAFSSGNVYPLVPLASTGATEDHPIEPLGEYGQSVLGRERIFAYGSHRYGTRVAAIRLNYAIDLRYGVLVDIATAVRDGEPIDLAMGHVNVVWQGYANEVTLRALHHASSPPTAINLTGPEIVSVRRLAHWFGERLGREPVLVGQEQPNALLNDASRCHALFGYPDVTLLQMVDMVADWLLAGGELHGKPTKFQVRSGRF
ncbi:MAG: NAD(P)-dependent oxidoreductase [Trueperaceae bacterium]|nr:NAD(P)-dependent oxidoreductase [Trueperaceae bacterium]